MILIVAVSVFFATAAGAFGIYWILDYRRESLHQRFKEVVGKAAAPDDGVVESAGKWLDRFRDRFTSKPVVETDLVDMLSGKELGGARLLLNQAGYRSPGAYHAYILVRWALPIMAVILSLIGGKFGGMQNRTIFFSILIAGIVGFLLPDFALRRMILKRQEQITDALPDGLDLLVVCVEAGLGLNAAFVKITEEFRLSSPALSEEFDIVNREMVAGKPRQEALRALSERTGVEDVKSLVAMLIQTEKLGTSLAQSLRVHSDSLRLRRRQRAEEAAAKTTIKLVFPLVFLMFPALFIVILGPGALQIIKILIPMGSK